MQKIIIQAYEEKHWICINTQNWGVTKCKSIGGYPQPLASFSIIFAAQYLVKDMIVNTDPM